MSCCQCSILKPLHMDRFILVSVLNIANWCSSCISYFANFGFAKMLLIISLSNVWIYLIFYMIMKLIYKEKIGVKPATYLLMSLFIWSASGYFFFNYSGLLIRRKPSANSSSYFSSSSSFFFLSSSSFITWHSNFCLFLPFLLHLSLDFAWLSLTKHFSTQITH